MNIVYKQQPLCGLHLAQVRIVTSVHTAVGLLHHDAHAQLWMMCG